MMRNPIGYLLYACFVFFFLAVCSEAHTEDEHDASSLVERGLRGNFLFPNNGNDEGEDFGCGTPSMSARARSAIDRAVDAYKEEIAKSREEPIITIPVCFHILTNRDGKNDFSDEQAQGQIDHMNEAFSATSCCDEELDWCEPGDCSIETGIRFAWQEVDGNDEPIKGSTISNILNTTRDGCLIRYRKNSWTKPLFANQLLIKRKTHKGGLDLLNVWWAQLSSGLNGYSNDPPNHLTRHSLSNDGVVASYTRIYGSRSIHNDEGDLLVHEVGHWLGLSHTFQGIGCRDPGDGIPDTNPQHSSNSGCKNPLSIDTCDNDGGIDPVFNFMDYSDDRCTYEFTPLQALVMRATYNVLRLGKTVDRDIIPLTSGVPSEPLTLPFNEYQTYSLDATSTVTCKTKSDVRHALYLEWDKEPRRRRFLDDCVSKPFFHTDNECKVRHWRRHETVFATVQATKNTFQNLTITCTAA